MEAVKYDFDSQSNTVKISCVIPDIKERTAYQVGNNIYRTKAAAAKKVAWNWILTKYAANLSDLSSVKSAAGLECDCAEYDDEFMYKHEACEIHNRNNGYFKRLHKNAVEYILRRWEA